MHIGKLVALFNPDRYHGWGNKRNYFEGWYYKVVDQAESRAFAFIPGIAMASNGEKHAFIQVLDGKECIGWRFLHIGRQLEFSHHPYTVSWTAGSRRV